MAIFYPSIEYVSKMKVPPTEGELSLLNFLINILDDDFEVYFNPYMNGDRPDIVIVHKRHGVKDRSLISPKNQLPCLHHCINQK